MLLEYNVKPTSPRSICHVHSQNVQSRGFLSVTIPHQHILLIRARYHNNVGEVMGMIVP